MLPPPVLPVPPLLPPELPPDLVPPVDPPVLPLEELPVDPDFVCVCVGVPVTGAAVEGVAVAVEPVPPPDDAVPPVVVVAAAAFAAATLAAVEPVPVDAESPGAAVALLSGDTGFEPVACGGGAMPV